MDTLNKLLDSARKMCSRDSDAAVAERLKVSRTTLMQWRTGDRRITDEHLMEVIELAKEDPALAVLVRQEMAKTKAEKKAWGALWDRLSAAAAVLALVMVATPGVARAKAIDSQGFSAGGQPHSVYYVLRLLAWLARLLPSPRLLRWHGA
ncbi:DUF3693 domain-containing protein [Stenotrophomonas maltophilia]|uniref:DUF3693 domain-containing protein n=1 Tax=Stenotrophomonas maltophilia TaxID=40324 RepID=UPI002E798B42|nr:DUF3693 domain-containing protein [Stenotrophomonas maltophilia]